MDLLTKAKEDLQRISQGEFSVEATFQTPDEQTSVVVRCLGTSHREPTDQEIGTTQNSKKSSVAVSQQVLTDQSYPFLDGENEPVLLGHFVSFNDSSGILRTYEVSQQYPDKALGLIVCILSDLDPS